MAVGPLYNKQKRLNRLNHCEPRISATGTLWHGACILIRVHTFQHETGADERFIWSRRPPLSFACRPGGALRLRDLLLVEQLLELAGLVHLHHDVGAADELALYIELRHGRPVRIFLHPLADLGILEDVDGFEADA